MKPVMVSCAILLLFQPRDAAAQPERSKTSSYVKVNVTAAKPNADGRQQVAVTLDIHKDFYLMGRDLPDDIKWSRLNVDFSVDCTPVVAMLVYPAGKKVEEKVIGDYAMYLDKVVISGVVLRAAGDDRPLEAAIRMQGYPRINAY